MHTVSYIIYYWRTRFFLFFVTEEISSPGPQDGGGPWVAAHNAHVPAQL